MKYFIFGNSQNDIKKLILELSNYYKINNFLVTSIVEMNKIVKDNKDWIIESSNNNIINELCNLAEVIIYLDYSNHVSFKKKETLMTNDIKELLKKQIRKGIIIKNKKELKIYLKSVYESDRYIY